MPEGQEWERHWNTLCLSVVTIGTAVIGVALFSADIAEVVTSLPKYCLVVIAIFAYLNMLLIGGRAIYSTPDELARQETSKRQLARNLYGWFMLELLSLAGLLIIDAFASLLQSLAPVL